VGASTSREKRHFRDLVLWTNQHFWRINAARYLLFNITEELGCSVESEEASARMLPWFYLVG
jgi:hypothetical protein